MSEDYVHLEVSFEIPILTFDSNRGKIADCIYSQIVKLQIFAFLCSSFFLAPLSNIQMTEIDKTFVNATKKVIENKSGHGFI